MPKKTLKDFSGGLNTRLSKGHIADNEAQDSIDVDLSGSRIQPVKGVDESVFASGDYKFRDKWITDEEAISFTEYGDSLIKSYENKKPQFQSIKAEGGLSPSIELGVPPTPAPPRPVLQVTGTARMADKAYAYHTAHTESVKNSGGVASGTGDGNPLEKILSSTDYAAGHKFHLDSAGGFSFFKEGQSNDTSYSPDYSTHGSLSRYDSSYSLTFTCGITHWNSRASALTSSYRKASWFFKGDYFVGVSETGISKKLLTTGGLETTHAFSSNSDSVEAGNALVHKFVGDSCVEDSQDGVTATYPHTTVHDTSISADSDEIFISRVQRGSGGWTSGQSSATFIADSSLVNGQWNSTAGCVHKESTSGSRGTFNYSSSSRTITLKEGTWYVILWIDPAWVTEKDWIHSHPLGTDLRSWIRLNGHTAVDFPGYKNKSPNYGWTPITTPADSRLGRGWTPRGSGGSRQMAGAATIAAPEGPHDNNLYTTGMEDAGAMWSTSYGADGQETLTGSNFYDGAEGSDNVPNWTGAPSHETAPTDTTHTGIFHGNDCSSISQIDGSSFTNATKKGYAPLYRGEGQIKGGAILFDWGIEAEVSVGTFPTYIFEIATMNKLDSHEMEYRSHFMWSQKNGNGADERTDFFIKRNDRRLGSAWHNPLERNADGNLRSAGLMALPEDIPHYTTISEAGGLGPCNQKFLSIYHDFGDSTRKGKGLRYRWHQLEQAPLYHGGSYIDPDAIQHVQGKYDYAFNTIHMKNLCIDSSINALKEPDAQNKCVVVNSIHKLAFTAVDEAKTSFHCTEGIPDYKIQDRNSQDVPISSGGGTVTETLYGSSYNWACTPLFHINSAKKGIVSGSMRKASNGEDQQRQAARYPQFGFAISPTSQAETSGTEYVPSDYLRGTKEYELSPPATRETEDSSTSASLVTSGWLPYKVKTTFHKPGTYPIFDQGKLFQSLLEGRPASPDAAEYKIGLADTSVSDLLTALSSQPQVSVTQFHQFYANDNGVLIRGGVVYEAGAFGFLDYSNPLYAVVQSHPLSAGFAVANPNSKELKGFNKYEVKSDVVLFYNPSINIIDPSDMGNPVKHLDASDVNITAAISRAFLSGNITTGKLLFSTQGLSSQLVVIDLSSDIKERSLYRIPSSHFIGFTPSKDEKFVLGATLIEATKRFENITETWIVYPSELETGTVALTSPDTPSGTSSGIIKKILSKNGDPDIKFFLISTSANQEWTSPNLTTSLSESRDLTFVAEADKFSIQVQNNTTSSTTLTLTPQDAMRNINVGDTLTATSVGVTSVPAGTTVTDKGGTTITLSALCTTNVVDTLTFTRYVKESDVWFSTADFGNVVTPIDYTSDYDLADTYSGVSEKLSFTGSANDYIPISKIGQVNGEVISGDYAYDSASNYYFRVFLEKRLATSAGITVGEVDFTKGLPDMFSSVTNLPFQYRISLLRNIGTTANPSYIESGASQESGEISLSTDTNYVTLRDLPSGLGEGYKIRIYRTGGIYASYGWLKDVGIDLISEGVDDQNRIIGSSALPPLSITTPPPFEAGIKFLKYISYVSGLFYAGYGSTLRISEYGNPHSWPEVGYYPLDGIVTGIRQYQGEGLVWTANSAYRIRGTSYDDLTIVKIPDQQGMPEGNYSSLIESLNSLFWISNDGICMYANGRINVVSQGQFKTFPKLVNAQGAAKDNVLHFFTELGHGMACDLRSDRPKFSKISEHTDRRAFYSQTDDRLFLIRSDKAGAYGDGVKKELTYTSGTIDFENANEYKVFHKAQVRYRGTEGSITFKFQEGLDISEVSETFSLTPVGEETTAYLEFGSAKTALHVVFSVTGAIEVLEISIDAEPVTAYATKVRFESADVIYRGGAILSMSIDQIISPMTPELPYSALTNTVRVYFPSATEGYIPHYTNSGSGEIISATFNKAEI